MRTYAVEFSKRAVKQLHTLDHKIQIRLRSHIDQLAHEPRPPGVKKLSGNEDLYRIRIGDYRILYQIQDKRLIVLVVEVGHRREVYRGMS